MDKPATVTSSSIPLQPGTEDKLAARAENAFGEAETGVTNDVGGKIHRTRGLWIFDNVLFNLTNLSVFALSVYATYKTNFSQSPETPKALQNWWMKRGSEAVHVFKKTGLDEKQARNANMVLWSFVDGTVAAPFVAMLEHRRSDIGRWIDDKLSSKPKDAHVYDNQPKLGWKSVLSGRLAAFSVVMPTFFLLKARDEKNPASLSLNNILFDKPAEAIVEHNIAGIPRALERKFPALKVKGLINTALFELFYTTLCTSILFGVSFLSGKKEHQKQLHQLQENNAPTSAGAPAKENAVAWRTRVRPLAGAAANHADSVKLRRSDTSLGTPA